MQHDTKSYLKHYTTFKKLNCMVFKCKSVDDSIMLQSQKAECTWKFVTISKTELSPFSYES